MILLSLVAKYGTATVHKQTFPLVASKGYYEGHLESKERSRIQPAQLFQCS
jgi:hypothetical protein